LARPGTGRPPRPRGRARIRQASFIQASLIAVLSSDLLSNWYGESEDRSHACCESAPGRARHPLLDEIDSLAPERSGLGEPAVTERLVNALLAEMDGLEDLRGVVVIAASNRPALIDLPCSAPAAWTNCPTSPSPTATDAGTSSASTPPKPLSARRSTSRIWPTAPQASLAPTSKTSSAAPATSPFARTPTPTLVTRVYLESALHEARASVTREMDRDYQKRADALKRQHPRGPRRIRFDRQP